MAEARYHVRFVDAAAGESLGLLLQETPQVGLTRRLINPYAAKGSSGATKDSDLTEWSVVSQRDWRGGRGQEDMEEASAFLDAWNLETRIKEQLTLGPLPQNPVGTLPKWEPGSTTGYLICNRAGTKMSRAQSFTAPAGGITCDLVQVFVRATYRQADVYTVSLCSDSGGVPGAVLKTATITVGDDIGLSYGWVEVEWASGQALAGSTLYHITIEPPASTGGWVFWGGDNAEGYADGSAHYKTNGTWLATAADLYFRVNTPAELDGEPVGFARYAGSWYCGAGDTVYVWNDGTKVWDVSDAQAGDDITAVEVWGGFLWVARDTAYVLRRYNGISWADAPGSVYARWLRAGGGYLHRAVYPPTGSELSYTANGTDWSSGISVGAGDYVVLEMAWYRDMLVCATAVGLWGISAELAYPLLDWSSQEDDTNGKGMVAWGRTGCLYIPLRYGLYRWNGDTMVAVGPEQGTGLPAGRAGKIAHIVGTGNWLFVAVDAGASGKSSILAYNGMGGWHELQRAEQTGQRIQAIGFETVHSPSRLWLGMDKQTRYLMLPDYSDNPYQWSGYEFNPSGELEGSWLGGELLEVVKDLYEVVIRGEGIGSAQPVTVFYEVDRSGLWTNLGEVTESPREALEFTASSFATKTVGSGSTKTVVELGSGDTSDLEEGDWCRIDGEVRQVESITDSDTFVLATALEDTPSSGDVVYPSKPAGREFRLKLVLETEDKTATPRIKAVFLRYQNNVLDRFVYALQVRVEDGMTDLAGNPYPHTAADLRVLLDGWATRATAFTLYDQDGVAHTVKVTSVGEGGMTRKAAAGQVGRYGSVYSMNVVEVG